LLTGSSLPLKLLTRPITFYHWMNKGMTMVNLNRAILNLLLCNSKWQMVVSESYPISIMVSNYQHLVPNCVHCQWLVILYLLSIEGGTANANKVVPIIYCQKTMNICPLQRTKKEAIYFVRQFCVQRKENNPCSSLQCIVIL